MNITGTRALAFSQRQAWDALNDPEILRACIPGCESIQATGENRYAIQLAMRVGPVAARFSGAVRLEDVDPPSSYALHFDGQAGPAGFGKGLARVSLTPAAAGTGCELSYTAQAQVGGKIAQLGQRLVDSVARSVAQEFFKSFDEELERRHQDATAALAPASAPKEPKKPGGFALTAAALFLGSALLTLAAIFILR